MVAKLCIKIPMKIKLEEQWFWEQFSQLRIAVLLKHFLEVLLAWEQMSLSFGQNKYKYNNSVPPVIDLLTVDTRRCLHGTPHPSLGPVATYCKHRDKNDLQLII
ncbi:hypothetical protein K1T71_005256 [Dendrolimus kikuchii]|uniref:Uncharacterized protein n=1 Tax=Dendrolimus kikuchii TaxID=765133 RepID=A0ACC1D740_9NEOP|nr:hypothetical protein K1T71_005256 [Dendrolimus kikuchii]